ncbi:sensor histidine kinase [Planotetraspora kaengkrachanensis]|uniref:histidine kinase n=1 Tax=Planotetraspora kaengkrachanensis TaxID=575193 RepID=A0A8J3PYB1_9ACTN|nr:ATP-binding protein [Planotetraspora kaengkrachanensis]GIG83372.1 hypothetical protein Pka01_64990 [Planotetraspora kaengkrachanensis]
MSTLSLAAILDRQQQFVADASHELRTPLAGLRAQLEDGRLHPEDTDMGSLLEGALLDVDRLESIITDLLLLARVGASGVTEKTPLSLSELARCEVFQRTDRVPTRMRIETGVLVTVVRSQIVRLLRNLLDNAQRHSRKVVEVSVRPVGRVAELAVGDDGAGIPECDRERVFERFSRLDTARDRDHGGTGLGLAIARAIAHAHEGTLKATESHLGGALFLLRIPLAES